MSPWLQSTPAPSSGGDGVHEARPRREIGVDVVLRARDRADRPGPHDRLPDAAVRQPDPDEAGQEIVGAGATFVRVADGSGSERVARSRPEMMDVPRQPDTIDGRAHPVGK